MSDKLREEIEEELKAKTLDQWEELSESKGTSFARRGALLQRCLSELEKVPEEGSVVMPKSAYNLLKCDCGKRISQKPID